MRYIEGVNIQPVRKNQQIRFRAPSLTRRLVPKFAILSVLCVLAILFFDVTDGKRPLTAKQRNTTQEVPLASTTVPDLLNAPRTAAKTIQIPKCFLALARFGASTSFECTGDKQTKIHYEYLDSAEQLDTIISEYGLTLEQSNHNRAFRSGQLNSKSRLLAVDKSLFLVVDIESKMAEIEIAKWWNELELTNGKQP